MAPAVSGEGETSRAGHCQAEAVSRRGGGSRRQSTSRRYLDGALGLWVLGEKAEARQVQEQLRSYVTSR